MTHHYISFRLHIIRMFVFNMSEEIIFKFMRFFVMIMWLIYMKLNMIFKNIFIDIKVLKTGSDLQFFRAIYRLAVRDALAYLYTIEQHVNYIFAEHPL